MAILTLFSIRYRVASLQQLSKGAIYMYLALYPFTHIPASVSGNKSLPVWEFWWDKVITEYSGHAPWWERKCSTVGTGERKISHANRFSNRTLTTYFWRKFCLHRFRMWLFRRVFFCDGMRHSQQQRTCARIYPVKTHTPIYSRMPMPMWIH